MPYEFMSFNRTLDTTSSSKPSAKSYRNDSSVRWDSPGEARSLTPHAFSTSGQHGQDEWIQREFPSDNAIAEGRAGTPPRTDNVRPRAGGSDGRQKNTTIPPEQWKNAVEHFLYCKKQKSGADDFFIAMDCVRNFILSVKQQDIVRSYSQKTSDKKSGIKSDYTDVERKVHNFQISIANSIIAEAALQSGQGASSSRGEGSSPGYEEGELVTGQEGYAGEERADTFANIPEARKGCMRSLIEKVINNPVHQYEPGYQNSDIRTTMRQEPNQMSRKEFEFAKREVNTNEDLSYKEKVIDILRYYTRHDSGASQYYKEW